MIYPSHAKVQILPAVAFITTGGISRGCGRLSRRFATYSPNISAEMKTNTRPCTYHSRTRHLHALFVVGIVLFGDIARGHFA